MNNFLTFEESSGEIVFIRRDAITSFKPEYTGTFKYRVTATVGKESYVIHQCTSKEEAVEWCHEQIRLIDEGSTESPVQVRNDKQPTPTTTTNSKLQ